MGRTSRSFWMNSFQYQMQSVKKKIRLQRRQFQKIGIFYLRNGILSTVKEDEVMNDEETKTCGSVIFYFFCGHCWCLYRGIFEVWKLCYSNTIALTFCPLWRQITWLLERLSYKISIELPTNPLCLYLKEIKCALLCYTVS